MRFYNQLKGEGVAPLCNPDRGWYDLSQFSLTDDARAAYISTRFPLTLLEISLAAFSSEPLSDAALENLRVLLARYREGGRRVILRPLYDWSGECWKTEPNDFTLILRHIEQLSPVLHEFGDVLFLLQGVLIGNWAEMHDSPHLNTANVRLLASALEAATDARTFLAVRTPAFWRGVVKSATVCASRVSVYDDALYASENDMGTFGAADAAPTSYLQKRSPKEERAFLAALGRFAPLGGETAAATSDVDGNTFLSRLHEMPLTYLNANHFAPVLDAWKQTPCKLKGIWRGKPCFDAIGAMLGYRLLCQQVKLKRNELTIVLQNLGSSPLYRDHPVALLIDGQPLPLPESTSAWQRSVTLTAVLPELGSGDHRLHLQIGSIRLANDGCFDDMAGANLLGTLA